MVCEGECDRLERWDRASSNGLDHGAEVGVEAGTIWGAEAAGDLSEGGAGAQGALGAVVGGLERSVGDEEEEVAPALGDGRLELLALVTSVKMVEFPV